MRWPWRRVLVDGDYVEPVETVPAIVTAEARRITLRLDELRAGQGNWLHMDAKAGRLEAVCAFPTGPSYAVRIPSDIARPLIAFLDGPAMEAVAALLKDDVKETV